MKRISLVAWTAWWMASAASGEGVHVEVVKTGVVKTPLRLALQHAGQEGERRFVGTLQSDLARSGWFVVPASAEAARVEVSGSCAERAGRLEVRCRVAGVPSGPLYLDRSWQGEAADAARLAHVVADEIVWAVRKVKGIASTRIALIRKQGSQRDVYVCDADGGNLTRLTRDGAICLAPVWEPGGRAIIYTSYHRGYPDVYRLDLASLQRERLVACPGTNLNGGVSPDGRRLALTLSKDGNPDLYIFDLTTRRAFRLTTTPHAAEASPSWSPDGRQLVYVAGSGGSSRRLGAPQLFILDAAGGTGRQITFRGSENVAPDWGPDGRIAYSTRREGRYQIGVYDPRTGEDTVLPTGTADHEDPSWARNGRHLVCSATENSRRTIFILDTLGDPPLRLPLPDGEWLAPAWSRDSADVSK